MSSDLSFAIFMFVLAVIGMVLLYKIYLTGGI